MKHLLPLVFAALLFSMSTDAQRNVLGNQFQVNSFGSYLGLNMDYHQDMSIDWMKQHTQDPSVIQIDEKTPFANNYAEVTGVMLGASVGFSPRSRKSNDFNLNQELIVSANVITGREALVTYDNYDPESNAVMRHTTMFCLMDNEVNLDAYYQFTRNWSIFKVNAGAGASLGSTFGCNMLVMRSTTMDWGNDDDAWNNENLRNINYNTTDTYEGVCSTYARAYATAGFGFLIGGHVELGSQIRFGTGTEYLRGSGTSSNILTGAFLTQVRYHIPKLNEKDRKSDDYIN